MQLTLTPRDLARIAEIHELRRRAGMPETTDERVVRMALTDGLIKERDELLEMIERFKRGPGLVMKQAS